MENTSSSLMALLEEAMRTDPAAVKALADFAEMLLENQNIERECKP